jgi:uncharacterized damage-inducible protein DinB
MPARSGAPFVISEALLNAWEVNDRINAYLFENVPDDAWRAKPPGGKGRDIASIAAHMHNVRLMWLKASGAKDLPEKAEPSSITKRRAIDALAASRRALQDTLRASLAETGKIKGFRPDAASFFGYLVAHDAHHRGQIALLARQSGHPLSQSAMFGMWEWGVR